MDASVKNLAGTVQEALTALSGVPDVAARLKAAAVRVAGRVSQVNQMTADLESAEQALALAVGEAAQPAGNGGPALDDTTLSPPAAPPPTPPHDDPHAGLTVEQARRAVEFANGQ